MTFGMGSSLRYRLFGDHEGGLGNLGRGTETDCLRALPRVEGRRRRCRRPLVAVDLPLTFFPLLLVLFFVLVFLLVILRLELVA